MSLEKLKSSLQDCGKEFFIANYSYIKDFYNGKLNKEILLNRIRVTDRWKDITETSLNMRISKVKMFFKKKQEIDALKITINSGVTPDVINLAKQIFKTETGREYNDLTDKIVDNPEKELYPEILKALKSDLVKELCKLSEFKFQKGSDKLNEFENYIELSNEEITVLLNSYNRSGQKFLDYIETIERNSKEYNLLILLGQLISYCDKHAANKNEFNEYLDKRTIARSGVRQNDWIFNLLNYKISGNDMNVLTASIKNAISYLKNPETGLTMLSENHREMVAFYLLKQQDYNSNTIVNDLITFFKPYDIEVLNESNRTAVYCSILYYFEDVRKLWFEHIEGLVACDNTGWIEEAIKALNSSSKIALWWDKSPTGRRKVFELLESNFDNTDNPFFYIYYSVNQQITYRSRIIDFSFSKNYNEKNWNKNDDVAWYHENFSEYQENTDDGRVKRAKVVFLADKIEKLVNPFDVNEIKYYKNYQPPTQNNLQPYVEINESKNPDNNTLNTNTMAIPLNQIFYGPPGTGKTYNLSSEAEKIINSKQTTVKLDDVGKFDRVIRYIRKEFNEPIYNKLNGNNIYRNFSKSMVVWGYFLSPKYDTDNTLIHEDLKDVEGFKRSGWSQRLRYLTEFGFIDGDWVSKLSGQLGFDMSLSEEGIELKERIREFIENNSITVEDLLKWPREKGIPLPIAESYIDVLKNVSPLSKNITAFQKTLLCALNMCLNGDLFKLNRESRDITEDEIELIEKYLDVNNHDNSDYKWIGWLASNLEDLGLIYKDETERNERYYFDLTLLGKKLIGDIINNWVYEFPSLFGEYINYETGVSLGQIEFITFHQSYSYEEFIEGIRPNLDGDDNLSYTIEKGIFKRISDRAKNDPDNNYVIIIDEINRGNISKIFGELITLIEPSKRLFTENEEYPKKVILPYSKKPFGVPNNLYLLGTMNTADKSIALLDSALRRRFVFTEMLPSKKVVEDEVKINGLAIGEVFSKINDRIEFLIDKDHTIGHSYFLKLKENPTVQGLANLFKNEIIPLLQEYFYGDYEKIRLVLGDNKDWNKDKNLNFFVIKSNTQKGLFGTEVDGFEEKEVFTLTDKLDSKDEKVLTALFSSIYNKEVNFPD